MSFTPNEKETIEDFLRGEIDFDEAVRRYSWAEAAKDWLSDEKVMDRQFKRWRADPESAPRWLRWLYRD